MSHYWFIEFNFNTIDDWTDCRLKQINNLTWNITIISYKDMLSSSLFGAFNDQISTSSITYPDGMNSCLIRIYITELNQRICRVNTTISQQKYVFPISILMWLLVYILERIIYISTAHISPEIFYGI